MKKLIYLITFILAASLVSAAFDVSIENVKTAIDLGEVAEFNVVVENNGGSNDYRIYYSGVEWDIKPVSFTLSSYEQKAVPMTARPLYVTTGQHSITLNVRSSETIKRVPLIINIREKSLSEYVPSVGVSIGMPEDHSPEEPLPVSLTIRNRNPLDLEDLSLQIDSDYFSEIKEFSLNPTTSNNQSEQEFDMIFDIPSYAPPGDFVVTFRILSNNETIYLNQRSVDIETYSPDFNVEVEEQGAFFKTTEVYTVQNVGNLPKEQPFRLQIPLFRELFTSENPKAGVLREEGNRYLVWDLNLEPGEEYEVAVVRNYRPFLLLLLIIGIVTALYFIIRSPVNVYKSAQIIKKEEGGISMLKIQLKVKNISEKEITDVRIYDRIPNLADYVKEEHIGSLAPNKILKHEHKGTLLKWEIPVLEGFEERIITYKMKAQLRILGGLKLPVSNAKFKVKGRNRASKSNIFKLLMRKQ